MMVLYIYKAFDTIVIGNLAEPKAQPVKRLYIRLLPAVLISVTVWHRLLQTIVWQ